MLQETVALDGEWFTRAIDDEGRPFGVFWGEAKYSVLPAYIFYDISTLILSWSSHRLVSTVIIDEDVG